MTKRPSHARFTLDQAGLARKLCMLGATDDDLARLLEVPRETIDAWFAQVAGFAAAVRAGRDVADATVAERLYARAIGYSHAAEKIHNNRGEIVREPDTEHSRDGAAIPALTSTCAHVRGRRARRPSAAEEGRCPTLRATREGQAGRVTSADIESSAIKGVEHVQCVIRDVRPGISGSGTRLSRRIIRWQRQQPARSRG
jgi:hypothetical protein